MLPPRDKKFTTYNNAISGSRKISYLITFSSLPLKRNINKEDNFLSTQIFISLFLINE